MLDRVVWKIRKDGWTGLLQTVSDRMRGVRRPPPRIFPEHRLAHELLDGLKGLELGASAHNPFGLDTRNVSPEEPGGFFETAHQRQFGIPSARIDIRAPAHALPLPDRSEDFILSSHVVEHLPNVIGAFVEWNRVIRHGGYVFMIVPLRDALPQDVGRPVTPLEHFISDFELKHTIDTHPLDGVPGPGDHYHIFTPDTLRAVVGWMNARALFRWDLVARENIDTKVGNGFTLAYRVVHSAPLA